MKRVLGLLIAVSVVAAHAQAPAPPLDELLGRVGKYVADYERAFSVVVSRERYIQRAFTGAQMETRELHSEIALIAVQGADWVMFRDVYRVDGRDLSDRKDRLLALFLKPPPDAGAQARRIYDESTRHNIGQVARTINAPTQMLEFFRATNHRQSTFRLGGQSTVSGQPAQEIRFQETGKPRLIATADQAPSSGRVWVRPDSGAIVRTELNLAPERGTVQIAVHYAWEPRLELWVPARMIETYVRPPATGGSVASQDSSGVRVEGEATYSDFRRFNVDTRTIVR